MLRELGVVLLLAASAPGSCGKESGASDGAAGEPAKPSPATDCETYATTWCNKAFGCYADLGRIDSDTAQTDTDDCVQQIEDRLPCSNVTDISDTYDKCIAQITGMSCSRWDVPQTQFGSVTPPASCTDAFVY